jgi:hypothetical protein
MQFLDDLRDADRVDIWERGTQQAVAPQKRANRHEWTAERRRCTNEVSLAANPTSRRDVD